MKIKTRIKLVVLTALLLILGITLGRMNLGAKVLINDNFQYQPNAADFQGTWQTTENHDMRIALSGVLNTNIELGGLSAQDLRKITGSAKKGFAIQRDAGTFFFEGSNTNSHSGSGKFYFRPDAEYADKMNPLLSPGSDAVDGTANCSLYYCAVHDLSYDYAARIIKAGLKKASMHDLLRLCSSGVTPEYIRVLAGIGYQDISPDDLILLTVQKVPADFIKYIIGTSDNLPTIRELTLIWMYGDQVADFKRHKKLK